MTTDTSRSALEWLRQHYDDEELVCPDCGYRDDEGAWASETDGSVVHYYHECPGCDAVREHTVHLDE